MSLVFHRYMPTPETSFLLFWTYVDTIYITFGWGLGNSSGSPCAMQTFVELTATGCPQGCSGHYQWIMCHITELTALLRSNHELYLQKFPWQQGISGASLWRVVADTTHVPPQCSKQPLKLRSGAASGSGKLAQLHSFSVPS